MYAVYDAEKPFKIGRVERCWNIVEVGRRGVSTVEKMKNSEVKSQSWTGATGPGQERCA